MLSGNKIKFLLLLVCANIFCVAGTAEMKEDSTHKTGLVLKGDVMFPLLSLAVKQTAIFSVTTEKLFHNRHSLQLTYVSLSLRGSQVVESYPFTETRQNTNYTFEIIPEYKFYVSKKKNYTGYYIGAYLAYINHTDKVLDATFIPSGYKTVTISGPATLYTSYKDIQQSMAAGIINGFQYYLFNHLVIDFLVGGGLFETIKYKGVEPVIYAPQFYWRLAFNVGYKF